MDQELDDLWDGAVFGEAEPRYLRVRKMEKVQERFRIREERRGGVGFSPSVFYRGRLETEPRRERVCKRALPSKPFRVLDAPSILNDYYLNLLDWSSQNILGLGLSEHLYLWNAQTKEIVQIGSVPENNYVSGIAFGRDGLLAAGMSDGNTKVFDCEKGEVCALPQRSCRVSAVAWGPGVLSAGAKDGSIFNFDIRSGEHVSSFLSHTQEVCGLKWDSDMVCLASGSNDNTACVWRMGCTRPRMKLQEHTAAVRAVAWCPWKKGVLSTGGGASDKCIKTWDVEKEVCIGSLDTESQVCSLLFSERYKELISTHGYSDNNICVWKFCTMRKVGKMEGHTDRVLFSALSPDGNVLATCAADENLNFWSIFDQAVDKTDSPAEESVTLR